MGTVMFMMVMMTILLQLFSGIQAKSCDALPKQMVHPSLLREGYEYRNISEVTDVLDALLSVHTKHDLSNMRGGHLTIYGCHDTYENVTAESKYWPLLEKVDALMTSLEGEPGHAKIISVRVLIGEQGAEPQQWHIDYGLDNFSSVGLLIPITASNEHGTTELLGGNKYDEAAAVRCATLQSARKVTNSSFLAPIINCSQELNTLTRVQPAFSREDGAWLLFHSGLMIHRRGPQKSAMRLTLNIDYTTNMGTTCDEFDFINAEHGSMASLGYVDNVFVHFEDPYNA